MIAVFARANHPEGWGFPSWKDNKMLTTGKAHGYVVLAITYKGQKQLDAVTEKLKEYPDGYRGLTDKQGCFGGNLSEWFGGQFEYLFSVGGTQIDLPHYGGDKPNRFQCRGDNRFVGHYTAEEVLDG